MKRIVVKIGSRVLTNSDGSLNVEMITDIVKNIARIMEAGIEIILVTSGAVSTGKSMIKLDDFRLSAEAIDYDKNFLRNQILASVGQAKLIRVYQEEFQKYGINAGQILVSRKRFADRDEYLSLKMLVENQLRLRIVPIFNEDDTLRPAEMKFSDNDQVACMITAMTVSDLFIILTDVDGVLNGPPDDPVSQVIPEIMAVEEFMDRIDDTAKISKGGMRSKLLMADLITSLGSSMRIVNGFQKNALARVVLNNESLGTFFPPKKKKASGIKSWLATSATSDGKIIVSTYLADILRRKQTASILFAGIEKVEGNFNGKDVVDVCDDNGIFLGRGIVKFSSSELEQKVKWHKEMPGEEREAKKASELIAMHYDYFVFV